jgi:DNA-binding XRE family transcriptional regulator
VRIDTNLGSIVKAARLEKGFTQETLAEVIDVGARHIMSIENEGTTPSFKVLYRLIRVLRISADSIFYPEKPKDDLMMSEIIRILENCDERSLKVIRATAQAALDSQNL